MSDYNNRRSQRKPYIATIRYYCPVIDHGEAKKIDDESLIIDISSSGVGMFVGYPFEPGHVLYFREIIRNADSPQTTAVVRWTEEIYQAQYRVGCEFA